jgi:tetrapyrrole methylase family protein/MazG family protein
MTVSEHRGPHIDVVGLGPAGPELITAGALALMDKAAAVFLRTRQHPSAIVFGEAPTFDHHYERADTFDEVYRAIADDLVDAARRSGLVAYAVPGSPMVAERSVSLLKEHPTVIGGEVSVTVQPAVSFLDLSFARLGIDPMTSGVRMVDGESFAIDAAGERGPLLVAQCWSPATLSDIKLSVESMTATSVTVLHHLGLADERVFLCGSRTWPPRWRPSWSSSMSWSTPSVSVARGTGSRPTARWLAICWRRPTRCWRPSTP